MGSKTRITLRPRTHEVGHRVCPCEEAVERRSGRARLRAAPASRVRVTGAGELVVMLDVLVQDSARWRREMMRRWSRHSLPTVPTHRSAYAFAFGAFIGVRSTLAPSVQNSWSNEREYLASRSRSRNRARLKGAEMRKTPTPVHRDGADARSRPLAERAVLVTNDRDLRLERAGECPGERANVRLLEERVSTRAASSTTGGAGSPTSSSASRDLPTLAPGATRLWTRSSPVMQSRTTCSSCASKAARSPAFKAWSLSGCTCFSVPASGCRFGRPTSPRPTGGCVGASSSSSRGRETFPWPVEHCPLQRSARSSPRRSPGTFLGPSQTRPGPCARLGSKAVQRHPSRPPCPPWRSHPEGP
jgi:hypothetical protein